MREYISKTEMNHCRQAKEIFRDLSENGRDFCRFRLCSVFPLFLHSFTGTLEKILWTFNYDCLEALHSNRWKQPALEQAE